MPDAFPFIIAKLCEKCVYVIFLSGDNYHQWWNNKQKCNEAETRRLLILLARTEFSKSLKRVLKNLKVIQGTLSYLKLY